MPPSAPSPAPPFDRAIALACTLPALRTRWVHVQCGCGASHGVPIKLVMEQNLTARSRDVSCR